MMMPDDMTLVREFAARQSEPAFAALVERHIGLIHSAALRQTGDAHLAEEITQAVFIILARKAATLGSKTVLAAWLYRTTRYAATDALRAKRRRQIREQEAFMQSTLNEPDTDIWAQLAPLLDDAMADLGETDRTALVLRYFENKTAREIADALRMEEGAAQKRVARALEKLRARFVKRGVTLTATVIAGAVAANSVQAAPAGLAVKISVVAAKGSAITTAITTTVKGALKIMAWTKIKTAVVVGLAIALTAGTSTIVVKRIIAPPAPFVRIVGEAQLLLFSRPPQVVARAKLVIFSDGKSYRISCNSEDVSSQKALQKTPGVRWAYDIKDDYGCDGTDLFLISDRQSLFNRTNNGLSGFAFAGRFPGDQASPMIQAAWLAYCSSNYFNTSNHETGLELALGFTAMTLPDFITNQVTYWPDSTLPQTITGWSRNWVVPNRTSSLQPIEPIVLKQYPSGYKSWKFTASNLVVVGNMKIPQQFMLESFFPKPPDTATTGDETELLRKLTFVATSIEVGKGRFNPFPPVTLPDLQLMDSRFEDIAGSFVIASHATPKGWPTRGSKGFKQAAAEAEKIASDNRAFVQSELKKKARVVTPP